MHNTVQYGADCIIVPLAELDYLMSWDDAEVWTLLLVLGLHIKPALHWLPVYQALFTLEINFKIPKFFFRK